MRFLVVMLAWTMALSIFVPTGIAQGAVDPTADRYYRGNALYNRKMYPLAVEEYKLFLSQQGNHPKAEAARHGMALSYYAMEKYAEAESVLKSLVSRGKIADKEQLRLLHGQCLLALGKPADAEKVFSAVVRSRSKDVVSNGLAGVLDAQFRQRKWSDCIATADRLLKTDISSDYRVRGLYQAASACLQLGEFGQALPYLEKLQPLVKDDPMTPQVAFYLAESYRETGTLDKAAEQYAAAVGGFAGALAAEIYYRLGYVQFAQAHYDDAIMAFNNSLKTLKDGTYADDATLFLGRAWLEKRDFRRAVQYLQPLSQKVNPHSQSIEPGAYAALWLGRAYSRQDKYEQAATVLAEALKRHRRSPLQPDMLFDRGNALMARQAFAEAASSFAGGVRFSDWAQLNDAMRLRAVCLHQARDFNNSLNAADEYIARFKDDPLAAEVVFVRAENLYLLDRLDEAATAYSRFMAGYPAHQSVDAATFRLAQIKHKKDLWAEALKAVAPLVAKQPQGEAFSQLDFIVGDCNFRIEQWAPAVTHLAAFLDAHKPGGRDAGEPNQDSALIELALAYINLGNADAAIERLKALITHFDKSVHRPRAISELGRLQYEAGDMRSAQQTLSPFAQRYPKHPQRPKVEYYLGWIALKNDAHATAEEHFAVVANTYPRDTLGADAAMQLGRVQISQEKFDDARKRFENLIRTYPEHPRMDLAVFSLGVANARLERWSHAVPHFKKVTESFPKSEIADRAIYEWAWCEKGMGRKDAAAARYRQLIESYPQSDLRIKATTEMAELTHDAGNYDEVIAELTETLARIEDPTVKAQTLYRLGTAYYNKGDFEQSATTFEDFSQQFPKSALIGSARFQAGESRMKIKETRLARDHFQAASRTDGLESSLKTLVFLRLGETEALLKNWTGSRDAYRVVVGDPQWGRHAAVGLGWAEENLKQYSSALKVYRTAIDPKKKDRLSARAQFQLGECLFAQKRYDDAIRELVPVHTAYPYKDWAAKALLETGRILEAKGDADGAMAQFREVVRKYPDDNAAVVAKSRLDALRR